MPYYHDGMGGEPQWVDPQDEPLWQSHGWAPVNSGGGSGNIATNAGSVMQFLNTMLAIGQLDAQQYANLTQRLQTQGNLAIDAFNAGTSRGSAAGGLFRDFRGPRDYFQYSDLSRSSGAGPVGNLWQGAMGLTDQLNYGQVDPANLDPLTWGNSGMGDMFKFSGDGQGGDGAGGGDEGPAWKARLRAEGIDYRDVPEPVLRLMKSGDPETRNQAISDWKAGKTIRKDFNYGDPSRGKQGDGGTALEPFLDAYGNWVFPEGYTGPRDLPTPPGVILPGQDAPYQTRQEYEQGQSQQTPQEQATGLQSEAAPLASQGIELGGSPPAEPVVPEYAQRRAGETGADYQHRTFYESNPVMREAQKYGTPDNAIAQADGSTLVKYRDGSQRRFDATGRQVGASDLAPGVNRGIAPPGGQQPPRPAATPPAVSTPVAPKPSSGGGSKGANPGNTSSNDRDTLVGTRAEEAKKTGVHVNAASRRRAKGGMDVVGPKWAQELGNGRAWIASEPTRFAKGGQQFLVGEGGDDELVTEADYPDRSVVRVDPLERDDRGVTPDIAALANGLVPGDPYSPKDGPLASPTDADAPCPCCGMPIGAHEGMGEGDQMPMDEEAPMPMGADMPADEMDMLSKPLPKWAQEMKMATGGMAVMQPISAGAKLVPSAKPFKPAKPKKNAPALHDPQPQYVKDGKVQALVGPNKYKTMNVADNLPYQDANQIRASVWNNLSPMEMGMIDSQVERLGDSMETFLHRRAMGMKPLQGQGTMGLSSRLRRGY